MSDESFQAALAQCSAPPALRQAAMLIHALAPQDRHWVMEQLPAEAQGPIGTLLEELRALGIPRDRRLIETALQPGSNATPMEPDVAEPAAAVVANHAAVDEWVARNGTLALAKLLAHEPTNLVSRLLALRDWTWRSDLLRQLPPAARRDLVDSLRHRVTSPSIPDPAANLLLDLFERHLAAQAPATLGQAKGTVYPPARGQAHEAQAGRFRFVAWLRARGRRP